MNRQLACECKCFGAIMFILWNVAFGYSSQYAELIILTAKKLWNILPLFLLPCPQNLFIHFNKDVLEETWTLRSILPIFSQTSRKSCLVSFQQWKLEFRKLLFSSLLGLIRKDQWQTPSKSREEASTASYKRKMRFVQDVQQTKAEQMISVSFGKKASLHLYFFRT